MAHKKIVAIFNDYAAAENATYQIGKQHVNVSDMAFYQKEAYENKVDADVQDNGDDDKHSLILGYNNVSQISEGTSVPISGLKAIPDYYAGNMVEGKLISKFSNQIAEGQIIWTVKVDAEKANQVCGILDHCGAVSIERM
jgi:hypothetical protein